jgi:hypothetical protein
MSKFCTETCRPCPAPIPGRGRGESRCEQNGCCQLVNMDDLPKVSIEPRGDGIEINVERKLL